MSLCADLVPGPFQSCVLMCLALRHGLVILACFRSLVSTCLDRSFSRALQRCATFHDCFTVVVCWSQRAQFGPVMCSGTLLMHRPSSNLAALTQTTASNGNYDLSSSTFQPHLPIAVSTVLRCGTNLDSVIDEVLVRSSRTYSSLCQCCSPAARCSAISRHWHVYGARQLSPSLPKTRARPTPRIPEIPPRTCMAHKLVHNDHHELADAWGTLLYHTLHSFPYPSMQSTPPSLRASANTQWPHVGTSHSFVCLCPIHIPNGLPPSPVPLR